MIYEMRRTVKQGRGKNGGWLVRLTLPYFPDRCLESINLFYRRISDMIAKLSEEGGLCSVLEMKVIFSDSSGISLYGDLYCYRDKKLVKMMRISDNRDKNGLLTATPKKIKRLSARGGWYFDGELYHTYKNDFVKGSEVGVRRGNYFSLIPEICVSAKEKNGK